MRSRSASRRKAWSVNRRASASCSRAPLASVLRRTRIVAGRKSSDHTVSPSSSRAVRNACHPFLRRGGVSAQNSTRSVNASCTFSGKCSWTNVLVLVQPHRTVAAVTATQNTRGGMPQVNMSLLASSVLAAGVSCIYPVLNLIRCPSAPRVTPPSRIDTKPTDLIICGTLVLNQLAVPGAVASMPSSRLLPVRIAWPRGAGASPSRC